ncbi:MAG: hypothetical protein ACTSWY_06210, partial [Promethearchaeota archaeon]
MSQNNLNTLVKNYFSRKYLYKEMVQGQKLTGRSGKKWNFDGLIKVGRGKTGKEDGKEEIFDTFGVFIKDWNRSIGVNQIRQIEKGCMDMSFAGGIIIGNM